MDVANKLVSANDNNRFRFYVYAWCYPEGTPFYVGRGSGRRYKDEFGRNTLFQRIVAKIRRDGAEPTIVRWHDGLREEDATRLEVAYIRLFGRRDNGTGVLCNMTDGGDGVKGAPRNPVAIEKTASFHRGRKRSADTRAKISAGNSGKKRTAEMRLAMSAIKTGVRRTPESIDKYRKRPPTGKYKGVSLQRDRGNYKTSIIINGKYRHIGRFPTEEEAARAYDRVAVSAGGLNDGE